MRRALVFLAALGLLGAGVSPTSARAGVDPFIGELMLFGGSFCPRGWAEADGQLVNVASNEALFSIYGTLYGGDGRTTFGLPDLRGRVPLHTGRGPGLSNRVQGSRGGQEAVTLTESEIASHAHALVGTPEVATERTPGGKLLASKERISQYSSTQPGTLVELAPESIAPAGGSQPHDNMPPYLTLRWCVALTGVFPSRN